MTYPEDRLRTEAISQPVVDRRRPGSGPWLWLIALAAVLIVGALVYGWTNDQQQAANPPAVIATPAPAPQTPPPAAQTTTGRDVATPPAPAAR
jgi:hypothetical protein